MNIFLSPLAERKLAHLLSYLELKWSARVRQDFLTKLDKSFNQISTHPGSCPESSEFPNLFKCIVTKQTAFFYRISSDEIEIITIIDNRQDPSILEEELRKWR